MRRIALAIAAVFIAVGGSTGTASAVAEFCDWDPPLAIITPGGNLVLVHDSVWTSRLTQVGLPLSTYTATRAYDSAGIPVTRIDVAVYVAPGLLGNFSTRDYVATGPLLSGAVLASASGRSGSVTHLKFTLDTP